MTTRTIKQRLLIVVIKKRFNGFANASPRCEQQLWWSFFGIEEFGASEREKRTVLIVIMLVYWMVGGVRSEWREGAHREWKDRNAEALEITRDGRNRSHRPNCLSVTHAHTTPSSNTRRTLSSTDLFWTLPTSIVSAFITVRHDF